MQWDPMCGVDGETYGNLCMLDAADVKLDYEGECLVAEPVDVLQIIHQYAVPVETFSNLCMLEASGAQLDYEGECLVAEPVEETPTITDNAEVTIGTVEQSGFGQDCVADGCYTPNSATVDVGGVVTMTNTDTTGVHTFTSGTVDGFTPSPSGTFDSDILMSGDSFEWIPDTVGEVPYYCMLHTWMQGTITVQEAETAEEVMEEVTMEEEVMEEVTMEEEVMEEVTMEEEIAEEVMEEIEATPEPVEETPESSMALTISIPKGVGAPGCETTLECYLPYEVTVAAGTTITWINDDTTVHTVTSGKITEGTTGLFDSSIFSSGKSFEYTFNNSGTYDYFCNVHPWMAGIVNVS